VPCRDDPDVDPTALSVAGSPPSLECSLPGGGATPPLGELLRKKLPPMHSPNEPASRPSSFGPRRRGSKPPYTAKENGQENGPH